MSKKPKIILAITGASGHPYAKKALEILPSLCDLHVIYSKTAPLVFQHETSHSLPKFLADLNLTVHASNDFLSPLASGSNSFDAFIVLPCSMKTMGQIAHGVGESLITRVADIALKERRKMILVVREAPFSSLHLQNMLSISQWGGIIFPAAPGFYHQPKQMEELVDFVVGRVLNQAGLDLHLTKPWKA